MKTRDLLLTANKNILKSKLRTFLTIIAVMVGSMGLTLSFALGAGTKDFLTTVVSMFIDEDQVIVTKSSEGEDSIGFNISTDPKPYIENTIDGEFLLYMTQSDIDSLHTFEEVEEVYPEPAYRMNLKYFEYEAVKLDGMIEILRQGGNAGETTKVGSFETISEENQVGLSVGYVDSLDLSNSEDLLGKEITLVFENLRKDELTKTFKVGAILDPSLFINNKILISEAAANEVLAFSNIAVESKEALYTNVTLKIKGGVSEEGVVALTEEIEELGMDADSSQDIADVIQSAVNSAQAVLVIFSGVVIAVAVFGVINTLLMSVFERTQEIGLMKALGMKRKSIFFLLSFEAASIGFWGSIIGYIAGFLLGHLGNYLVNKHVFTGLIKFDPLIFTIPSFLTVIASVTIICVLAGFLPALRATRLDPIVALRRE